MNKKDSDQLLSKLVSLRLKHQTVNHLHKIARLRSVMLNKNITWSDLVREAIIEKWGEDEKV
jgi:hypothetical protein